MRICFLPAVERQRQSTLTTLYSEIFRDICLPEWTFNHLDEILKKFETGIVKQLFPPVVLQLQKVKLQSLVAKCSKIWKIYSLTNLANFVYICITGGK